MRGCARGDCTPCDHPAGPLEDVPPRLGVEDVPSHEIDLHGRNVLRVWLECMWTMWGLMVLCRLPKRSAWWGRGSGCGYGWQ